MILVESVNVLKQAISDVETSYHDVLRLREGWHSHFQLNGGGFREDIIFEKNMLYLSSIIRSVEKTSLGKTLDKNNLKTSLLIEITGAGKWVVYHYDKEVFTGSYEECSQYRDRKSDLDLMIRHFNTGANTRKARVLKICSVMLHSRKISVAGEGVSVAENRGKSLHFKFEDFMTTLKQCIDIDYKGVIDVMCNQLKNQYKMGKSDATAASEVNWLLENSFGSFVSDLDKEYASFCNDNFIDYFLRQEYPLSSTSDIMPVLPIKPYAVMYNASPANPNDPNEISLGFIWKGLKEWITPDRRIRISQILQSIQDYTNSHSDDMEKFYLKMKQYKQKYKQMSMANTITIFVTQKPGIEFDEIKHLR